MLRIFDSHAHYYDGRFDKEAEGGSEAILRTVMPSPVARILNVGTNCETSRAAIAQAKKYEGMYAAAGIHPEDCHLLGDPDAALKELSEMLCDEDARRENKIVALGEIGLDYHWQFYGEIPMDKQKQAYFFEAQMNLARQYSLPVIIHDREAHGDCFDIVLKYPDIKGVFHSYSGSAEMAKELVKRGWYISFSGVVSFKNAAKIKEVAAVVPDDRILIETDAPYLAPHPHRGKINHSGRLIHTAQALAEARGCDVEQIARLTRDNVKTLFGV